MEPRKPKLALCLIDDACFKLRVEIGRLVSK
jgi:hypothetical protein